MDVGTTEDVHLFVSDPKEALHHDPIKKTDILNSNPDEMRTKHWPNWLSFALYPGILCTYIYYGSRAEGLSASNRRWKHAIDKVTELLTETNEKFDEMSQSNE